MLFIVKKRATYCHEYGGGCSYSDTLGGLYNSALFVVEMLNRQAGITAAIVQVVDNNEIDRQVTLFRPDLVILEALWVVPSKFTVLTRLHPDVKWIVRIHSEIPFLAMEGIAVEWISAYVAFPRVSVASNSERSTRDLRAIVRQKFGDEAANTKIAYLPNWYPIDPPRPHIGDPYHLNIACFGAIRPLKNQLIQALAAIEFADQRGDELRFHINATRCEQQGENVLRNLRALFARTDHELVEHKWESHSTFLNTLAEMDLLLGVSFTETFNITSADAVAARVPIVVSPEITWASRMCFANPTDTADIVSTMGRVTGMVKSLLIKTNLRNLRSYDKASVKAWLHYLKG